MTIGLLVSGKLGFDTLKKIKKEYKICFILTDKNSLNIIDYTKNNNIPFYAGNPRKGKGYNFIKNFNVDIIISINYLYLIEEDIIDHSNLLTFNIHGSLLPKYRGRTPHVWAIINGEKTTGITAHLIDSGCDTGAIIDQVKISIDKNDTGGKILEKYTKEYYPLTKKVLQKIKSNQLSLTKQIEENASYFGKRTPLDGEINWNWQKERIRNWVRAQSFPYPGAFSYYNNEKIIIDKVSFTELGFNSEDENGLVIFSVPKIFIKCPNGVLELTELRDNEIKILKGTILV